MLLMLGILSVNVCPVIGEKSSNMKKLCIAVLFGWSICGAYALPQDWPCDEVVLQKAGVNEDGKGIFRGADGVYQIRNFHPLMKRQSIRFLYNCGNSGSLGDV